MLMQHIGVGYFGYYRATAYAMKHSLMPEIARFTHFDEGLRLWRRALRRRSQKDDTTWTKANKLAAAWLPRVRVLHPWPVERFTARHPRQEPGA
ncbi:reverse transcriptase [Klebsiella pneumoniae]|nr:reverse transcriptase [Klebsiella pneumoniae]